MLRVLPWLTGAAIVAGLMVDVWWLRWGMAQLAIGCGRLRS